MDFSELEHCWNHLGILLPKYITKVYVNRIWHEQRKLTYYFYLDRFFSTPTKHDCVCSAYYLMAEIYPAAKILIVISSRSFNMLVQPWRYLSFIIQYSLIVGIVISVSWYNTTFDVPFRFCPWDSSCFCSPPQR